MLHVSSVNSCFSTLHHHLDVSVIDWDRLDNWEEVNDVSSLERKVLILKDFFIRNSLDILLALLLVADLSLCNKL